MSDEHSTEEIRDMAARWAIVIGGQIGSAEITDMSPGEIKALRAWVARAMAAEIKRREHIRKCDELAAKTERIVGAPAGSMTPGHWDGLPDDDREALARHIASLLRGAETLAWRLCEWAGWPS